MRLHWTTGIRRHKRENGRLYWRSACGRWLRLGQMAPDITRVDCKICAAYLERLRDG